MNRRFHVALVLLAALCVASSVRAQGLQLVDALTFTADSLVKGAAVRIGNPTTAAVAITAIGIDSVRSASGVAQPSLKVSIPAKLTIEAGDTVVVLLRGDPAWLQAAPGLYTARVTWAYAGGQLRGRLAVTAGATVRPLATNLKLRPINWLPWGSFSADVQVPVRGGVRPPPAGVFPLAMQDGSPAVGRVDSVGRWSADPSVAAYWVRLDNLRGGRSYTGTIPLVPGDDQSNASVIVEASDHVIWVLLVVLIGVLAGIGFRKWMNVGQTVSLLRERELLLGGRFKGPLGELQAVGGPAARLGEEVKMVRRALEARLKGLSVLLAKDATGIEQAQKQLDELEAQADAIREVARAQKQLVATIPIALQVAGPAPPPEGEKVLADRPRLVIAAQGLIKGEKVGLKTLASHGDALTKMNALLERWIAVYQELRLEQAWIERLRVNATPEELEALKVQAAALRKVRWNLWDAEDEADFNNRGTKAAIDQVEEALRLIVDKRISGTRKEEKVDLAAAIDHPASAADAEGAGRETSPADLPVADQTAAAVRVRHLRGLTDLTLGIAAFIVAVITMLGAKYLDHPFGTLTHYATALGWAFGTTAGMDLIASGLASLRPVLARIAER